MSKRTAAELQSHAIHVGKPYSKASRGSEKREDVAIDEMGEFEDAWEDELESDEDVVDAEVEEREDGACLH
jgi:ribosome assembly protein RRB1